MPLPDIQRLDISLAYVLCVWHLIFLRIPQLIDYDPVSHLLPVVCEFASQSLESGKGHLLAYPFGAIQQALSSSLLAGAWNIPE